MESEPQDMGVPFGPGYQPTASAGEPSSRSGIPDADLIFTIRISPEMEAIAAGELLMDHLNATARWGYSTREFQNGNFREVDDLPPLDIRTICCGCWANTPGSGDNIAWYRSDDLNLDLFLHWDGDGTIVIRHPNWLLENGDCKGVRDWEWVDEEHWSKHLPEGYYEDDAAAIEARRAATTGAVHESAVRQEPPNPTKDNHHGE